MCPQLSRGCSSIPATYWIARSRENPVTLPAAIRILSRNAAFSGLPEPATIPIDHIVSWQRIPIAHDLCVWCRRLNVVLISAYSQQNDDVMERTPSSCFDPRYVVLEVSVGPTGQFQIHEAYGQRIA